VKSESGWIDIPYGIRAFRPCTKTRQNWTGFIVGARQCRARTRGVFAFFKTSLSNFVRLFGTRSNGEYLVFVEEDAKGKVIMYKLPK
jgi:hypothetical protein